MGRSLPDIERIDTVLPVPPELGQRLLAAKLYAEGSDFSASAWMGKDHQGSSRFKALWEARARRQPWDALTVWVLSHHGQDVGVIVWERPSAPTPVVLPEPSGRSCRNMHRCLPAVDLGGVGAYLHPEFRGRGWVRAALASHAGPALVAAAQAARGKDVFPYVAAEGAMETLLRAVDIPVSPFYFECGNKPSSVWSLNDRALLYDSPYRLFPKPLESAPAVRRRMKA